MMLISPLVVTALAIPILREPVGPRRWAGVVLGMLGAVIIVGPGSEFMSLGILLPAAAACSFAIYPASTHYLLEADPILTTLVFTALMGP